MRIAVLQVAPVTEGAPEALDALDSAAADAAGAGARVLVAPEMFLSGYAIGADAVAAAAEPADGPSLRRAAAIARARGVALCFGFPLANPGGAPFNAAALIGADGALRATYAKTHLYGAVDRAQFAAGPALSPVVDLDGFATGLAICYDIEFPELTRAAALAGADLILVPTANMQPFTSVCERIVPARAEENRVCIAYANYAGEEPGFTYCGRSVIAGPDGVAMARAGDGPALILADLDRAALAAARAAVDYLPDRRPELYGPLAAAPGADAAFAKAAR
jgi:predicted amidohydrolase